MHELSLCQHLCETLSSTAASEGFSEIRCIRLRIGKQSCVEPRALEFCFAAIDKPPVLANARLEIQHTTGEDGLIIEEIDVV